MFVATRDELAAITEMLTSLDLTNAILRLVHRDGSPWIEFTTVPIDRTARAWDEHVAARAIHRPLRFALWRYTLAVYRIGSDGAVEDDPIWTPERA